MDARENGQILMVMNRTEREHRLVHFFREVGHNFKVLGGDIRSDMSEAVHSNDPIKMVMAPVVGAVTILVSAPNALVGGVLDSKMEPRDGLRTGQEFGATVQNIATLHPLRALNHAWNTLTVWPEDVVRVIGGFQTNTHGRAASTLAMGEIGHKAA